MDKDIDRIPDSLSINHPNRFQNGQSNRLFNRNANAVSNQYILLDIQSIWNPDCFQNSQSNRLFNWDTNSFQNGQSNRLFNWDTNSFQNGQSNRLFNCDTNGVSECHAKQNSIWNTVLNSDSYSIRDPHSFYNS